MTWNTVQKLVEGTGTHSTLIGKFWISLFFVIRLLLVMTIARGTWSGTAMYSEQMAFKCNTLSPGCELVCFNEFYPILPVRYWSLQLLAVSVVTIMFNIFTMHTLALVTKAVQRKKKWKAEQRKKRMEFNETPLGERKTLLNKKSKTIGEEKKEEKALDKSDKEVIASKLQTDHSSKLYLARFSMVFFRLVLEIVFMVGQYYIYPYKFVVPELFKCRHWPCPNVVDCFVSRPKEQTILLCVFYATGCIMVVLNIMELLQLGGKLGEAWRKRYQHITEQEFGDEDGPHFHTRPDIYLCASEAEGVYTLRSSATRLSRCCRNTTAIPTSVHCDPNSFMRY